MRRRISNRGPRVLVAAMPALIAPALIAVAGCTLGPDYEQQSQFAPTSWFDWHHAPPRPSTVSRVAEGEALSPSWWSLFHDRELTALESRIVAENLDVRTAGIRLAESRAQASITGAGIYPTLNGNTSYTYEKASNEGVFSAFSSQQGTSAASGAGQGTSANGLGIGTGGEPATNNFPPFSLWQYGFDASWEPDIWGSVRRQVESANASVHASEDAERGVLIEVQAEVARDYVELRGTQETLRITRENLGIAQESLHLTQERAAGGLTTDLDVANAQAQVDSTAAEIPQLEQQEAADINALSQLLGQPPGALEPELVTPKPVPPVPPTVPVGLPSELARRRPDIREAEEKLHSATADIGVAVAAFYPTITLSGSVGIQALQFKDLGTWNALQYAAGPSLTLPIFEGGQLHGTLELRRAQQKEAAVKYQQTVLQAWHDVDNALTAYAAEQRRRTQLARAVAANQRALTLARQRYEQGVSDFLDVLTAERSLLASQIDLSRSTTTISTNLVALYKALGGGWETTYPVQRDEKMQPGTLLQAVGLQKAGP